MATTTTETANEAATELESEDTEVALVENAYAYLTEKKYPDGCSKNEKRTIRRKAEQMAVRDGVLYYKKKDDKEVTYIASYILALASYLPQKYSFIQLYLL